MDFAEFDLRQVTNNGSHMTSQAVNRVRDDHLFLNGPKRILSLDGGGVLGVIEIAFLERLEHQLRELKQNPNLVLADYFDLIGGTSTGAIIATALSLGMNTEQVRELYFGLAPRIFRKPFFSFRLFSPKFNERALYKQLDKILGERQLQSSDLMTGLAIVSKRIDTGSPWILTNNPKSKFWQDPKPEEATNKIPYIGNKRYKLKDLLRASTAATYFFRPHKITIADDQPPGLFVDGGVSPFNDPSLLLLMAASIRWLWIQLAAWQEQNSTGVHWCRWYASPHAT